MADDPGHDDDGFETDLAAAAGGDDEARKRLWATHYELLRRCARTWFEKHWQREDRAGVSLGGTDILHVAFERLHDRVAAMANGKRYFFAVFYKELMRIAVDHYRKSKNDKGRGALQRVELQSQFLAQARLPADFEMVHDALMEFDQIDPRAAQVAMLKVMETRPVEGNPTAMRGVTNEEVAELLGMGLRTVEKDWAFAKAWLMRRLGGRGSG